MKKEIHIGVVIYRNCTSSMVTGFLDILTLANQLYFQQYHKSLFKLELVAESRAPISSFSGIALLPHKTFKSKTTFDLLYVPGFIGNPDDVVASEHKVIKWLQKVNTGKMILSAACNGNFLLASSGALYKKKATTHWSLIQKFRNDFKDVILQPEKIILDNGNVISAAGVTAYFNLALHLIQRFASADIALACAKIFLVDAGRRIQTPYQMYETPKGHGDDEINKIQNWLESNFKETINLDKLSGVGNIGKKTLMRRFKKATGETPLSYLQKLRIENAKRLLESKRLSFSEVTWEVGYSDVSSFHKVFKVETGLTPIEYRTKFSLV
jgi:transcriptional regulator GlxA family with amidase domain